MDLIYNDIIVTVESDNEFPSYRQCYRGKVIRSINFNTNTITIDIAKNNNYTEEMIIIHKVPKLRIIIE